MVLSNDLGRRPFFIPLNKSPSKGDLCLYSGVTSREEPGSEAPSQAPRFNTGDRFDIEVARRDNVMVRTVATGTWHFIFSFS